ncbi:RNA polymerase sigma-70 factor [Actinocrispum wychmicini]|uniref:RNA polymerase sigma-70 factor (ECF subfamily) n=1 Tax=Actinocrispum wychmicini TaxID=1213861 RepID=A0A4R2JNC7_9PSEU|nr:RNA polymerase sigma-70 factor [Actinocrispum wychmicini]TCO60824.1 RNA polymerase sigma-70 factor (ECF subfamily) [Actinocrispum wychmicini]
MNHEEVFVEYRPLLFTIAYEILGSAADAEDVLQDSYLRWRDVDHAEVANPRGYLVRTVTRQALNQLRTARRRREDYVGAWLPEPIRTQGDASEDAVLAESVSIAMLLVLETLSPHERAVFVLHEVFGYPYRDIADMVGKTDTTVRQIAHRAREHVQARRARFHPNTPTASDVVDRFLAAAQTGDVQGLMDMMAPDVVQIADGGGKVTAARRPIHGPAQVAQFVAAIARRDVPDPRIEIATYNALPALLFYAADDLDYVVIFEIADNLVRGLYAVRNPDKLRAATVVHRLTRGKDS